MNSVSRRAAAALFAIFFALVLGASPARADIGYTSTLSADGLQFHLDATETSAGDLYNFFNALSVAAKPTSTGSAKSFALENQQITIDCYVTNNGNDHATACGFGLRAGNDQHDQNNWTLGRISSFDDHRVAHLICTGTFEVETRNLLPPGHGAGGSYLLRFGPKASLSFDDRNGSSEFNLVADFKARLAAHD